MLRSHVGIPLEFLVEVDDGGGKDGEEGTETEDDNVSNGLGKGGVTLEVRRLATILGERRKILARKPRLEVGVGKFSHLGDTCSFLRYEWGKVVG